MAELRQCYGHRTTVRGLPVCGEMPIRSGALLDHAAEAGSARRWSHMCMSQPVRASDERETLMDGRAVPATVVFAGYEPDWPKPQVDGSALLGRVLIKRLVD